ncbi:hypothetical protein [Halorientalis regularis]|jgi:hypothetical protein|uniref:Uncharacterized protein n=1 Tax=Halorientalis regularis TaxID=660518 RepID=A0A1G7GJB3_9EURY|nr:hypothetical protein [Halorientalis regularis]SDE88185.1 hypothetical protein SAMN05216218_10267 [Halorientalis regularis]
MREEPPGPENADGFFDRFVHPWLARAASLGVCTLVLAGFFVRREWRARG